MKRDPQAGRATDRIDNSNAPILNSRVFIVMASIGLATMGYGVFGFLVNSQQTRPTDWVKWFVGALVAHDFVLAPIVVALGFVLVRLVPGRYRSLLQGALIVSAMVVITAFPFAGRFGSTSHESQLPNDYVAGIAIVVGFTWAVTLVAFLWRWSRRHAG